MVGLMFSSVSGFPMFSDKWHLDGNNKEDLCFASFVVSVSEGREMEKLKARKMLASELYISTTVVHDDGDDGKELSDESFFG